MKKLTIAVIAAVALVLGMAAPASAEVRATSLDGEIYISHSKAAIKGVPTPIVSDPVVSEVVEETQPEKIYIPVEVPEIQNETPVYTHPDPIQGGPTPIVTEDPQYKYPENLQGGPTPIVSKEPPYKYPENLQGGPTPFTPTESEETE